MAKYGRFQKRKITPEGDLETDEGKDVESTAKEVECAVAHIKPKELILSQVDADIADIQDYEQYASFHGCFCRCCFILNLFGILLMMFGLGLTPMFNSMAPTGAEMFIALGAAACCFAPCMAWTGLRLCPIKKYAEHRRYIRQQQQKRQEVADKRLRYLYNKEEEDNDEDEVVIVTDADKAIGQQIKLAQINAAYEEYNRALIRK